MNVRKNIVKPMLITFAVLIVLLAIVFLILHFFFPLFMSNFCYKLGWNNSSLNYLEKSYNATKNYNQLYSVVNLSIKVNNYDKIIKYYEEFSSNSKYDEFVKEIDNNNSKLVVAPLVKSKLYCEDNYLKNKYILALIKNLKLNDAYNYALSNFNEEISYNKISPYLFTHVLLENNLTELSNLNVIGAKLESYFEKCVTSFKDNYSVNSDKVKLLVIGNRVNEVASNLKALINFDESIVTQTQENINETVREINTSMAKLV